MRVDPRGRPSVPGGPIFFYTGNEGDVELYADHTGLMWENAETFQALLVFAEHRYYGRSQPFLAAEEETDVETDVDTDAETDVETEVDTDTETDVETEVETLEDTPSLLGGKSSGAKKMKKTWDPAKLRFLTHEQALGDYAELIYHLRSADFAEGAGAASPVVAFGGSYGGMLAAWMRLKYPGSVVGAVAASAPVLAFPGESSVHAFTRSFGHPSIHSLAHLVIRPFIHSLIWVCPFNSFSRSRRTLTSKGFFN